MYLIAITPARPDVDITAVAAQAAKSLDVPGAVAIGMDAGMFDKWMEAAAVDWPRRKSLIAAVELMASAGIGAKEVTESAMQKMVTAVMKDKQATEKRLKESAEVIGLQNRQMEYLDRYTLHVHDNQGKVYTIRAGELEEFFRKHFMVNMEPTNQEAAQ